VHKHSAIKVRHLRPSTSSDKKLYMSCDYFSRFPGWKAPKSAIPIFAQILSIPFKGGRKLLACTSLTTLVF
jgi:hypothetical protein